MGSLVQEFYEERGRQTAEVKAASRQPGNRPQLLLITLVLCLVVWLLPYVLEISPAPVSSQALEDGTRATIYLASVDISRFRASNGRLPATLADAGIDTPGLAYKVTGDSSYDIAASVNGHEIRYRSTMGRAEFLGSAAALLERR